MLTRAGGTPPQFTSDVRSMMLGLHPIVFLSWSSGPLFPAAEALLKLGALSESVHSSPASPQQQHRSCQYCVKQPQQQQEQQSRAKISTSLASASEPERKRGPKGSFTERPSSYLLVFRRGCSLQEGFWRLFFSSGRVGALRHRFRLHDREPMFPRSIR